MKKGSKAAPGRTGSAAEQMVAGIEQILGGSNVIIETNVPAYDTAAKANRELDVTVVTATPGGKKRIAIESRDRKGRQGLGWIDEIVGKYATTVGVDGQIAVSRDGFTRDAKNKARAFNIELRTLDRAGDSVDAAWFKGAFTILNRRYKCTLVYAEVPKEDRIERFGPRNADGTVTLPTMLVQREDGTPVMPVNVFCGLPKDAHDELASLLDEHGEAEMLFEKVRCNPPILVSDGIYQARIKWVNLRVEGKLHTEFASPVEIRRYRSAEQELAQAIRFLGTFGSTAKSFCLYRTSVPDDQGNVTFGFGLFDALK